MREIPDLLLYLWPCAPCVRHHIYIVCARVCAPGCYFKGLDEVSSSLLFIINSYFRILKDHLWLSQPESVLINCKRGAFVSFMELRRWRCGVCFSDTTFGWIWFITPVWTFMERANVMVGGGRLYRVHVEQWRPRPLMSSNSGIGQLIALMWWEMWCFKWNQVFLGLGAHNRSG